MTDHHGGAVRRGIIAEVAYGDQAKDGSGRWESWVRGMGVVGDATRVETGDRAADSCQEAKKSGKHSIGGDT